MVQHRSHERDEQRAQADELRGDMSLQVVLWILWTLAVVVTAYLNWHADIVAHHPTNVLGLVIHSTLVGVVGLVVMTMIEMHLEPWRFMD
jgi:hypothetical protein